MKGCRTLRVKPLWLVLAGGLLLVPLVACGRKVGDQCKYNTDCNDTTFDRICDLSQPGGYCTIEGCDEKSCPSESVCIRFFPRVSLTKPCDPAKVDDCLSDEVCLPTGLCAPRASERRYCAHGCDDGGDCRDKYECRLGGTLGSVPLTATPSKPVKFCAPAVMK